MSASVFADGREDENGDKAHHRLPCDGFRTFTQEKWASTSSKLASSTILASNFSSVFPVGLTVGGTKKIIFTSFSSVRAFLNQSGSSKVLTSTLLTNPTKSSYSNKLAAELVAAVLNVEMDKAIPSFATPTQNLANLKIGSGTFKNWTVAQLIAEANNVLGGATSVYSVNTLSKAIENINKSYESSEHGHDNYGDDDGEGESNLVCPIVFSSTVTNVTCKGANNGSITIGEITGGKDDRYTVSWNNGLKTKTLTNLSAGTYTVTITDKIGINVIFVFTITEPTVLNASSSTTPILCHGDSATITINATGGTQPYSGTGAFKVVVGTYNYTVIDANGCTTSTQVIVSEPTLLTSNSTATTILCNGGNATVTVSANGGVAPYTGTGDFTVTAGKHTYTITDANGCITSTEITISEPTQLNASSSATTILCHGDSATVTVSANGGTSPYSGTGSFIVAAGTHIYTVTDANGCSTTTQVVVSEPTALAASSSASTILCHGGNATVTISATGGTSPYTGTGDVTVSAGSYTYTVTDANNCSTTTTIVVSEPATLTAAIDAASISCYNGSALVIVSATGGTQPYTGTGSFTRSAGELSYTVTDANGCSSTATFTLTQPTELTLTGSLKNDNSCNAGSCSGVAKVVATGGNSPYTYSWTNATSSVDSAIGLCYNVIPSVTVTDANGCSKSFTFDAIACTVTATNCDPLKTYTQGSNDWGTPSTSNAIGTYITANFATVFPNGITIGSSSRKLVLTTSTAVRAFLPSAEDGEVLPSGTLTNPGTNYDNELAGELVAAKLNVGFDNYDASFATPTRKLKDMYCNTGSSSFKGKTIAELIVIADNILGGTTSASSDKINELNSILNKFNDYYSSSNSYVGKTYFVCEMPSTGGGSGSGSGSGGDDHGDRAIISATSTDFNVYPNPTVNNFTVNFSSEAETVGSLKLYNIAGQLISEEVINVTEGANYYEVDLTTKSIHANMIMVEVRFNDVIKHTLLIVK